MELSLPGIFVPVNLLFFGILVPPELSLPGAFTPEEGNLTEQYSTEYIVGGKSLVYGSTELMLPYDSTVLISPTLYVPMFSDNSLLKLIF